jgi:hypothetical protein
MVVGILTVELNLPGNNSLKEKRRVLKSLTGRVKSRFNVSIAEVGENEKYRRAVLGVAVVSNQKAHANTVLNHVADFIEGDRRLDVAHLEIELL